jgi:hypothetical protein
MRAEAIFTEALARNTPTERAAYLDDVCGQDTALRDRVETLLRSHEAAASFLAKPAIHLAAEELAGQAMGEATEAGPAGVNADEALNFLSPSDKPESLGRLAHYEVLEDIGRGSMGIVLRAFDEKLQRVVAIKVMSPELAATSPPRKRFLREARSAAAVRDEHVVVIHSVEEQPIPYLVMEYVSGETLQQRLDRVGPLEVPAVLCLGRQMALGLAAAHERGLIHRDIKPSNILIETGVQERVKITDFGLARAVADASLTQSGVIAGTPMYMAPEQTIGDSIDHRTDLFSLGSVLYTMCSGRPPFRATTSMATIMRVANDPPRPIRDIIPEVPQYMCDIVAKLHAKDPDERFQSAKEVADLLERCLANLDRRKLEMVDQSAGWHDQPEAAKLRNVESATPARAQEPRAPRAIDRPVRLACWRRRWIMAAALILSVSGVSLTEATGVTTLRATVIRIFTPDGTLVVETDDPAVKVTVEGDGDLVITGAGAQEVRLRPGSYRVRAAKDGKALPLDRDLVTITRGDKEVVRLRMEADAASAHLPIITDTILVGSFTVSVKLRGAADAIVRNYTINERLATNAGDLGMDKRAKAYPWGTLRVDPSPGPGHKVVLSRLRVDVTENWGDIQGESLGFTTVKTDWIMPLPLIATTLTAADTNLPLYFDETAGLDPAEITVTGALKIQSRD